MTGDPQPDLLAGSASVRISRDPGYWLLTGSDFPLIAFSTRLGGVSGEEFSTLNLGLSSSDNASAVNENRRRLCAALNIDAVATVGQVHGATTVVAKTPGHLTRGDILVTTESTLALAVSTADCLGVVLWDDRRRGLSVIHAGWRGVLAGAVESGLSWLQSQLPQARIHAAIGPGLRQCCFEVGEDVASLFPAQYLRPALPRPYLDLAGVVRDRLASAGIADSDIRDVNACTSCSPELFFSHRRDRGQTGRHWTLARLTPAP